MKIGMKYLITEKSNNIREWKCLQISNNAYKMEDQLDGVDKYFFSRSSNKGDIFWILKTDIDSLGNTLYKIIDEFE